MSLERLKSKVNQLITLCRTLNEARIITFEGNQTVKTVTLNCKNFTSLNNCFIRCYEIETIYLSNTQNVVNWNYTFQGTRKLIGIYGDIDFSSATSAANIFYVSPSLKDISFVPETIRISIAIPSAVLSSESIQSIIDGLARVETAQTLTLDASIALTDEQKTAISDKGWTLVQ